MADLVIESSTIAPPDWPNISTEILCPLCSYNLRGLIESRCPECGYQFTWRALISSERDRHRWLFEHRPRRHAFSYLRTFATSMRPLKFWREVQPIHTPRKKWLLVYWLIGVLIIFAAIIAFLGPQAVEDYQALAASLASQKASMSAWMTANPKDLQVIELLRDYGTIQNYLDAQFGTWATVKSAGLATIEDAPTGIFPAVLLCMLWPWTTAACLMIFRKTMRQAKILPVHVIRCVVYSADVLVFILVAAYFAQGTDKWARWTSSAGYRHSVVYMLDPFTAALLLIMLPVLTYRLAIAYRRYLQFPQAILSVALSQVIVLLLVLNVYFICARL